MSLGARAGAAAYLTGWRVIRHVPERLARAGFRQAADLAWRKRGRSVVQLERNLARVLGVEPTDPAVRELSREAMRSYLRYWSEAFRMPTWGSADVFARIRVEGEESLRAEYALGVGVVLALPHMANWDHAGAWVAAAGMPFTTVAEKLDPPELFEAFVAYRKGLGMEVLALDKDSGVAAIATLARRLRDGKLIALVADRDLTDAGLEVEFFGHPAKMPGGPAALSVSTGAGLIPVTQWYHEDHMHLRIHPKIHQPTHGSRQARIASMTQSLAGVFEAAIRANPADWHMLQRLWSDDLRLRHHAVSSGRPSARNP
ncbi:phosphatidylinositol mannoside acyltransferase [Sporichthya sp.]|uniref:phosphatidylinositol mannoside acyltransferase n=1 Tax=Sporichthya sp. TaxID=65475 RepID=UPI0017F623DD|nr:phosphatidylinositol mannoside acyltransferase [Sporichthya sp.]MBA3741911.1 phosphatidylinositol mannoside acyltransferase [Sporichthya sp.]